ncbi:MAG: hypothetical protein F6K13_30405 [Okeania sp. SIO2B9]|nr:hypothetical protein [Okeania sp. SIO2F5]NES93185.1 hypothetical protein [Okeania sp. SIO2B9]
MRSKVLWVRVGDRRQETGDNPPLAPPPPRSGEMGTSEEVGAGVLSQDCSAQLLTKILNF